MRCSLQILTKHLGSERGQWLLSAVNPCKASISDFIKAHLLRRCRRGGPPDSLVLCNHLGAEHQQGRRKFQTQQNDDGCRQRSVDRANLRKRREVPNKYMACQLPQYCCCYGANECVQ